VRTVRRTLTEVDVDLSRDAGLLAAEYAAVTRIVEGLDGAAFVRRTGAEAWNVRELLFHQLLDAQRALVAFASPGDGAPDVDAVSYWRDFRPDLGDGGAAHAVFVRKAAAAYDGPADLVTQWKVTAGAAARAAGTADPRGRIATQGHVLTVPDFVNTLLLEVTVHHLDLVADLDAPSPSAAALAVAREVLTGLLGHDLPGEWDDTEAVLAGTGRRTLTGRDRVLLGADADRLPLLG
jgi:Mycothiol maleylpyruvate isomerase N-terminal domain